MSQDTPWRIREAGRRLHADHTSDAGRELALWQHGAAPSDPAPMPAVALVAGGMSIALLIWGAWSALQEDEQPAAEDRPAWCPRGSRRS